MLNHTPSFRIKADSQISLRSLCLSNSDVLDVVFLRQI
jgi:hypothetical protein